MEITIKGKTIDLVRLTPSQMMAHAEAMRDRVINESKRQMVGLPLELCKAIYDAALATARNIDYGTAEHAEACWSVYGMAKAIEIAAAGKIEGLGWSDILDLFATAAPVAVAAWLLGLKEN